MNIYTQLQLYWLLFADFLKTTFGQGVKFPSPICPEVEKVWLK